ncbi:hypothetical protein AB0876_32260 [Mycobacterium sp. NPDC049093]
MTDNHADDLQERYDVFWQLDFAVSAIGPDDVTAEMAEGLLTILRGVAERTGQPANPTTPGPDDFQQHLSSDAWEEGWARFKRNIREERIRIGRKLGIEPEPGHS